MTRVTAFSNPLLLGFDAVERTLERVAKSGDGYPPYNIERLAPSKTGERLRITLAVAGFKPGDLDITAHQNLLVVQGRKGDEPVDAQFLHVGIAQRGFERRFALADDVRVENADLADGLLTIDLVREVPEAMKPKKIAIGGQTRLEVVESNASDDKTAAA